MRSPRAEPKFTALVTSCYAPATYVRGVATRLGCSRMHIRHGQVSKQPSSSMVRDPQTPRTAGVRSGDICRCIDTQAETMTNRPARHGRPYADGSRLLANRRFPRQVRVSECRGLVPDHLIAAPTRTRYSVSYTRSAGASVHGLTNATPA